ncbi:MAG TPA: SH3 domain-containing protein [Burkholderiales bacterium]|nr:SH3 domain-containing protein [Burkholderiales bacterium]
MSVVASLLALASVAAGAADYRSVADSAAVLYDAPSAKSKKLFVVNQGYPLEVVVVVEGWSKVRDANGDLLWVESKQLTDKRTVLVKAPLAQVREAADDNAPVVFQAQQNVLLEVVEAAGAWLRVRHRDGQAGFVRVAQVWGA